MSLQKFEEMGAAYLNDAQLCSAICGASEEKIKAALAVYPLSVLGSCSTQSLKEFGITKTQALRLKAALCLYARVPVDPNRITCSRDSANKIRPKLAHLETEEFWVVAMNNNNNVISMQRISVGGITATVVDVRMVAKVAISTPKCVGVILAHNHPSGNLKPSKADIDLTQKIKKGLAILDVVVLDHIIITPEGGYYSFADEGTI